MPESSTILNKINNITTIPTLPIVLERLTNLLKNPQTSAEEIGKAIATDQALASKVLKLVNSAFYGFPGKISTITHAVVILGFATIKNIVLTASILEIFKKKGQHPAPFNLEKFWFHSIACGAATKVLAQTMNCHQSEEYFIAGLIHDIGKIILYQYMPGEFSQILEYTQHHQCLIVESETQLFQVTHQEIGGVIAKRWNLPSNLQSAVCFHHDPQPSRNHNLITSLVHAADILVRAMDYGNGGDDTLPVLSPNVWNLLKLNHQTLLKILRAIEDEVEKASVFMQV